VFRLVRAETCSDVTCVIYTRKEVVAKEAVVTVFIHTMSSEIVKLYFTNFLVNFQQDHHSLQMAGQPLRSSIRSSLSDHLLASPSLNMLHH
jgi:hypothetical protein